MSLSAKKRVARGILPDNTGRPPWNKGLTKKLQKVLNFIVNNKKDKQE